MRFLLSIVLGLFAITPALIAAPKTCQDMTNQPDSDQIGAMLDYLEQDIDQDGQAEILILRRGEEGADLLIQASKDSEPTHYPNLVFAGLAGQIPSLKALKNGSVQIISQNDSIGRSRWQQILTLVYRQKAYRIGGFTWHEHDLLGEYPTVDCDLNLLTGKGFLRVNEGKRQKITTDFKNHLLKNWKISLFPRDCQAK